MSDPVELTTEQLGAAVQRIARSSFILGWIMRAKVTRGTLEYQGEYGRAIEAWDRTEAEILASLTKE